MAISFVVPYTILTAIAVPSFIFTMLYVSNRIQYFNWLATG